MLRGALDRRPTSPRPLAGALVSAFALACLARRCGSARPYGRALVTLFVLCAAVMFWWMRIPPSNDRDWMPDVAELPRAQLATGTSVTVENVRDFDYRSENDYDVRWVTRQLRPLEARAPDMFFSFWGPTEHRATRS